MSVLFNELSPVWLWPIAGGIFREDQKDSSTELAFKYAVHRLNLERTLLPNTTLVYDIQYVPRDDSFRTSKRGKTTHKKILKKKNQLQTFSGIQTTCTPVLNFKLKQIWLPIKNVFRSIIKSIYINHDLKIMKFEFNQLKHQEKDRLFQLNQICST